MKTIRIASHLLSGSLLLGSLLILPTVSMAASSCTAEGRSCEGTINLSVTLAAEVQVSGLQDVQVPRADFAGVGLFPATPIVKPFCVYSSAASGKYTITFTGTNVPSSGNVLGYQADTPNSVNPQDAIEYQVSFASNPMGTNTTKATNGTSLTGVNASTEPNCPQGDNASFAVQFKSLRNGAVAGLYTDTLNVLVTPN